LAGWMVLVPDCFAAAWGFFAMSGWFLV